MRVDQFIGCPTTHSEVARGTSLEARARCCAPGIGPWAILSIWNWNRKKVAQSTLQTQTRQGALSSHHAVRCEAGRATGAHRSGCPSRMRGRWRTSGMVPQCSPPECRRSEARANEGMVLNPKQPINIAFIISIIYGDGRRTLNFVGDHRGGLLAGRSRKRRGGRRLWSSQHQSDSASIEREFLVESQ